MSLSKQHKLLILLLSERNPLWAFIAKSRREYWPEGSFKLSHVAEYAHVAPTTIANWRKGESIQKRTVTNLFVHLRKILQLLVISHDGQADGEVTRWMERMILYQSAYESGILKIYDAAPLLGMSVDLCQTILDGAIYEQRPLLSAAYYRPKQSHDAAQDDLEHLEGLYFVWIKRGEILLQATLRVRYLLEVPNSNLRFIRCKLNLPRLYKKPGERDFEYDGFISVRINYLYWCFELRDGESNDYFFFITERKWTGKDDAPHMLRGKYLTTGQVENQYLSRRPPEIIGDDLLMHWRFRLDSEADHRMYRDVMWKEVKVLRSPEELKEVEEKWALAFPKTLPR